MNRLRAAANATIFSYSDMVLGDGIVGGPLSPWRLSGNSCQCGRAHPARRAPADIDTLRSRRRSTLRLERAETLELSARRRAALPAGEMSIFVAGRLGGSIGRKINGRHRAMVLKEGINLPACSRRRGGLSPKWSSAPAPRAGRSAEQGYHRERLFRRRSPTELNQPMGCDLSNTECPDLLDAKSPDLAQIREILGESSGTNSARSRHCFGLRNGDYTTKSETAPQKPFDLNDASPIENQEWPPEDAREKRVVFLSEGPMVRPMGCRCRADPII